MPGKKKLGGRKLVKAKFLVLEGTGAKKKKVGDFEVQFNPSEYTISRGVKVEEKNAVGKPADTEANQVVSGQISTLQITLYFDLYTQLASKGMLKNMASDLATEKPKLGKIAVPEIHESVEKLFNKVTELVSYAASQHKPRSVRFVWGRGLEFEGIIESYTVNATMFTPNGTPSRIKMNLTIKGEEVRFIRKTKSKPFESPDRTKERLLPYGDQLWMMADDEFGDPSYWKTIAKENEILNPRKIDRTVRLRVPSIK